MAGCVTQFPESPVVSTSRSPATIQELKVPAQYINLTQSPDMAADIEQVVIEANDDLNARAHENIVFRSDSLRSVFVTQGKLSPNLIGQTQCFYRYDGYSSCTVIISQIFDARTRTPEENFQFNAPLVDAVYRHEIGHAFGFDHFEERSHIMYRAVGYAEQLTESAKARFSLDLNLLRADPVASGFPLLVVSPQNSHE